MSPKCRIAVFADGKVGQQVIEFLFKEYPDDLISIICNTTDSAIYTKSLQTKEFNGEIFLYDDLRDDGVIEKIRRLNLDYIFLAWWPHIIKEPLLSLSHGGVINFHPSLLPYNRGRNYNFWTIVEESPFGVSLHFVDNSIDGGDIIYQKSIEKSWLDTGETLYSRAQDQIFKLFCESYPNIRRGEYTRVKQNPNEGSFHYSKELDMASKIELEKEYKAKDLLNMLRARTFPPHPAAWFESDGVRYQARISITKVEN